MQWLVYEVFLFIAAFQAIKGFGSNILFNTSTFGMHPSVTCITLHLNGYIYITVNALSLAITMHTHTSMHIHTYYIIVLTQWV